VRDDEEFSFAIIKAEKKRNLLPGNLKKARDKIKH
jgi:hypothetical protein